MSRSPIDVLLDRIPVLTIDREHGHQASVSAAETGVGVTVVDYLPEHSILVLEYIGTTQTAGPAPAPQGRALGLDPTASPLDDARRHDQH